MALTTSSTERGFPGPPEAGLTPADAIVKAQAMASALIARQAETEKRTYYADDTHAEFASNGFYRLLVPRRYGGYEFGIDTFLRVTMALARGCPSTGWMYCFGATHALAAASFFGERAQAELFSGGDFICPATIVPSGFAERTDDGHWLINGTWPYCSGAPYATHFMGHTLISTGEGPPAPMLFIAPRAQWRRLDDWGDQLGLRGSGSHSITIEGARIPDHLALPGVHISMIDVSEGTPGRALHGNPEYGGGPNSYMNMEVAALAVGMAQGALDVYEELLRSRTTLLPPIVGRGKNPDYQFWYGDAMGMIGTAEAALLNAAQQWTETCAMGLPGFTRETDLRLAAICRHVIKLCWDAVQGHIFPTAGSSSVRAGERLERIWRDLSMMHSHIGLSVFLPTIAVRELTRVRLGDPAAGWLSLS
ncbi:MAG TPA: acyl-CoA dehydrogenase family protein [Streptosporangiaceae bacterium]|jgi:3-hydroxy-9,10-secoandrosta-1,3,5(10)-triene-9,17-dione monooxygenase